jgi:hypothetical protein
VISATWQPPDADVQAFLADLERGDRTPGGDGGEQFADAFVVADPTDARVVPRDALVAALPQRRRMFEAAGVGDVRCVDAAQLVLDDHHVLVTSDWDAERAAAAPVRLESTYLLRRDGGRLVVLAYLNHRDLAALFAGAPSDRTDRDGG